MKFQKGKQYKCVKANSQEPFTAGVSYKCDVPFLLVDDNHGLTLPEKSKFIKHNEEEVKRGEYAIFWDSDEKDAVKLPYLSTIEGSKYPYQAVTKRDVKAFENGETFKHEAFKNMKQLPKTIEVPMKEALSILKAHKGSDCVIVEDEK